MISETHNLDCIEFMKGFPDGYFDLSVVDPPYGIGTGNMAYLKSKRPVKQRNGSRNLFTPKTIYDNYKWDDSVPDDEYFMELKRVSKNQIIWGANHFGLIGGMLVWDKLNGDTSFSDGEIAYCSFNKKTDIVYYMWSGMIQGACCSKNIREALVQIGDKSKNEKRIHPTQKPIALYDWIFKNYAKEGFKVLDTHLGSQSSRIAAYKAKVDFYGCELDPDYFRDGNSRFNDFVTAFEQEIGKEKVLKGQARLF